MISQAFYLPQEEYEQTPMPKKKTRAGEAVCLFVGRTYRAVGSRWNTWVIDRHSETTSCALRNLQTQYKSLLAFFGSFCGEAWRGPLSQGNVGKRHGVKGHWNEHYWKRSIYQGNLLVNHYQIQTQVLTTKLNFHPRISAGCLINTTRDHLMTCRFHDTLSLSKCIFRNYVWRSHCLYSNS